jgi:antirestriction protein ArdC
VNRDIYQTITERFIEQLKSGTVPWQKPWLGVQNIVSRKPYRGINALLLGSTEFQSPFWLSFKQAVDLGGSIKKGSKSTPVIYYKFLDTTDSNGNPIRRDDGTTKRIPFVRWSNVFNLDQTERIEPPSLTASQNDLSANERAADIVQKAKLCPIYHTGLAALYSPRDDVIPMPSHSLFAARRTTITVSIMR